MTNTKIAMVDSDNEFQNCDLQDKSFMTYLGLGELEQSLTLIEAHVNVT